VRLSDIATVEDSLEDRRNTGYADGKPAVLVQVFKQPSANIIDTVDRIYGLLPLLRVSIPPTINLSVIVDRTTTIRASIADIEYISRYLEMGLSPARAALTGAKEIGFTVLSMSTSLIAVFIPILLMGGILGRLFREFSVTLAVAIAISLVVSLTTTPSMCAKFLRSAHERQHG